MTISVSSAKSHAKTIENRADQLRSIQKSLKNNKNSLNKAWTAEEMAYVNNAFNEIIKKLSSTATKLDGISADIVAAAVEIKQEEEERRRRELERLWMQSTLAKK